MKVVTPEISWHERRPIYTADLQSCSNAKFQRLATAGVDSVVRMWRVCTDVDGKSHVEFLSNLRRHTATVNVVRFSSDGTVLATGGDDYVIILWKLNEDKVPSNFFTNDDDLDNKESWIVFRTLRGHIGDVYDLCWSSDGRYLLSGSVDNSALVWDIHKDAKYAHFREHKSYVQGVAMDPLGEYVATLSSDRSLRIFNIANKHCMNNVSKMAPRHTSADGNNRTKAMRIFHDDTLQTFFRRLTFTPDGQLLIVPSGVIDSEEKQISATFIFTRGSFKEPAAYLPCGDKASLAVRACPCLFQLRHIQRKDGDLGDANEKSGKRLSTVFSLPYRVVFAVVTDDCVLLYDTEQTTPFAYVSDIHYHTLSDITWSSDGRMLVVTSSDGYCTIITFEHGELGEVYSPKPVESSSSAQMKSRFPSDTLKLNGEGEYLKSADSAVSTGNNPLSPSIVGDASATRAPDISAQGSTLCIIPPQAVPYRVPVPPLSGRLSPTITLSQGDFHPVFSPPPPPTQSGSGGENAVLSSAEECGTGQSSAAASWTSPEASSQGIKLHTAAAVDGGLSTPPSASIDIARSVDLLKSCGAVEAAAASSHPPVTCLSTAEVNNIPTPACSPGIENGSGMSCRINSVSSYEPIAIRRSEGQKYREVSGAKSVQLSAQPPKRVQLTTLSLLKPK